MILRLLPHVPLPPARVLVVGAGADAAALHARGYQVEVTTTNEFPGGAFDAVCEHGAFTTLPDAERGRYVRAAAGALRPGGKLFGAFATGVGGATASELIHRFSTDFEVERLDESGFGAVPQLAAIFVRR